MKKILVAVLICNAVVFLGLVGYAGITPKEFAGNIFLLGLFRASGAGVFIAVVYFVSRLFAAGIRSASKTNR